MSVQSPCSIHSHEHCYPYSCSAFAGGRNSGAYIKPGGRGGNSPVNAGALAAGIPRSQPLLQLVPLALMVTQVQVGCGT